MLAMALLLHGGLLGGVGGEAAGVDGSGEGAWTLATPAEGFLAASGTGELAHLLHLDLIWRTPSSIVYSNAGAQGASWGHKVQAELSGARGGAERLLCVLC